MTEWNLLSYITYTNKKASFKNTLVCSFYFINFSIELEVYTLQNSQILRSKDVEH